MKVSRDSVFHIRYMKLWRAPCRQHQTVILGWATKTLNNFPATWGLMEGDDCCSQKLSLEVRCGGMLHNPLPLWLAPRRTKKQHHSLSGVPVVLHGENNPHLERHKGPMQGWDKCYGRLKALCLLSALSGTCEVTEMYAVLTGAIFYSVDQTFQMEMIPMPLLMI